MAPKVIKERVLKLRKSIDKYRYEYHVLNKSSISQEALDSLKKELVDLESKYPELITLDSPTQRVAGGVLDGFEKIEHKVAQWSFNDAFTEEDILDFDKKIKRFLKTTEDVVYVCELKIDGLKIVLEYENGLLKTVATRGDGKIGENITINAKTIQSIPLKLNKDIDLIAEGEAFVSKKVFENLNKERKKEGEELYANPRNFVAGTLRQLDSRVVADRELDSFIYDFSIVNSTKKGIFLPDTQYDELNLLKELGFKVNPHFKLCSNVAEVIDFWRLWEKKKGKEDYLIDGIVVKVNERKFQERLGFTGKAPRFGIACKFKAEQTTTIVEDIILQVGRQGTITPVAHLRPVLIAGSVVSRATLHNEDEIKRLDIKIGDTVILQKAGDVIPDIVAVLKEMRTGKERNFVWPKFVKDCGEDGAIERISGESAWKCKNKNSFAQIKRKFHYFVSKNAFDIDHCGAKVVDALIDANLISDYADIFSLKKGDLLSLPRFAEKSVSNLLDSIEKSKKITFQKFIVSLSIPQVGEETAILLDKHFRPQTYQNDSARLISNLKYANKEELEKIEGIGPIVARSIIEWFKNKDNQKVLSKLLKHINIISDLRLASSDSKLSNKTFVITGTLINMSRDEAKEKIRFLGGKISSSVSKDTDYLIAGENTGSKYDKALELGIKILSEKEFEDLIKNNFISNLTKI